MDDRREQLNIRRRELEERRRSLQAQRRELEERERVYQRQQELEEEEQQLLEEEEILIARHEELDRLERGLELEESEEVDSPESVGCGCWGSLAVLVFIIGIIIVIIITSWDWVGGLFVLASFSLVGIILAGIAIFVKVKEKNGQRRKRSERESTFSENLANKKKNPGREFAFSENLTNKFKPEARCMKCREQVKVKSPVLVVLKQESGNVRFAIKGTCPNRDATNVYSFIAKTKGQDYYESIIKGE